MSSPPGTGVLKLFSANNTQTITLGFFAPHFGQHPLISGFVVHVKLVCGVPVKILWDNASKNLWPGGISFFELWEAGSCNII